MVNNSCLIIWRRKKQPRIFYLDEGENIPVSSSNSGAKKGRGRPPKSAGSTKASIVSDAPKRARGRPAKTGETIPTKPVAAPPQKKKEEAPPVNGDASKKKRGRPSKGSTPTEQINGISKLQVNFERLFE